MFLLIGSRGYVGSEFARQLTGKGIPFLGINSDFPLTVDSLYALINCRNISFVINAAGYVGKPNVDSCELAENMAATLLANVILPDVIRRACEASNIPFGHVSTGCLYSGGNFSEEDKPNHYSFYSHSKELGEDILASANCYIWRLRMPFNEISERQNYLTKLITYNTLITERNSISHLAEFVGACLSLIARKSPFGIYNIVNPNALTPEDIISIANEFGLGGGEKNYVPSDSLLTVAKRSNCTLSTVKLNGQGIFLTDTKELISRCFSAWRNTNQ